MTVAVIAVALDRFGAEVLECARGWVAPDSRGGLVLLEGPREGDPIPALAKPLLDSLLDLTRAGAGVRRGGPRVQIAAFLDVEASGAAVASRLVTSLSSMLSERFAAIFDSRATSDQRNAALHVVARVPPVAATPVAANAMGQLASLESWAPPKGGYPLLARIWPLSGVTTVGTISDRGIVTTAAVWLTALAASDEVDALELRFRHPARPDARVSMFAAATLSTPEQTVAEYARQRARYDALARVAARVSRPAESSRAEALASRFPLGDLTGVVEGGGEAAEIRALVAERSGVSPVDDARIDVRPFDTAAKIRERNAALLEATGQELAPSFRADVRLSQGLERLTAKESEALSHRVEAELDRAFADQLAPEDGLQALPDVRDALRLLRARVTDGLSPGAMGTAEAGSKAVDSDPYRKAIEEALDALPPPARRIAAAPLAGLAAGVLAASLVAHQVPPAADYGSATPAPSAQAMASVVPVSDAWNPRWPWIAGGLFGAATALGYAFMVAGSAVRPIREVLAIRQTALSGLRQSGGVGAPRQRLEREIDVRARRLRQGIAHAIDLRLRRIDAMVTLVNDARDGSSRELQGLGVVLARPPATAAEDNLEKLFPEKEPLHGHLVAGASLAKWVAGQRKVLEPDIWATRIVTDTWDNTGRDGPCLDELRVTLACDDQVEGVRRTSMLSAGALASEAAKKVATFAQDVAHSLGPPVAPRSHTGDALALAPAAQVALVPPSEGDLVSNALKRTANDYQQREMRSLSARVAMVRFWEDFAIANLMYGAGLQPLGVPT